MPAALVVWIVLLLPIVACSKDGGQAPASSPAAPSAHPASSVEQPTFTRINDYRASKGLAVLTWNEVVAEQARRHSQDMASGVVPLGHDGFADRTAVIGRTVSWRTAAENVAMNWNVGDPVAAAVSDWLESPSHKANIEGDFDATGVGAATASNGAVYITQIFLKTR